MRKKDPIKLNKSIFLGVIFVIAIIVAVFLLMKPSEEKGAIAGQASQPVGTPPGSNNQCATGSSLVTTPVVLTSGQQSGSYSGCCPSGFTACVDDNRCYNGVEVAGNSVGNSYLCSQNQWKICKTTDLGYIDSTANMICVVDGNNPRWKPTTCSQNEEGLVLSSLSSPYSAYCNNGRWTNAGLQEKTSRLLYSDGTSAAGTTSMTGLCPSNRCVETTANDQTFCHAIGLNSARNRLCEASGDWIVCDASSEGTLANNGQYVCRANQWQDATSGCTQANANQVVNGNSYCDAAQSKWVSCSAAAGSSVICTTSATGTWELTQCGPTKSGQKIDVGQKSYYCSAGATNQWIECTADRLGQGINNAELYNDLYVCTQSGNDFAWVSTQCEACAGTLPGKCVSSARLDLTTRQPIVTSQGSIISQTGCVSEAQGASECYFDGNNYPFDTQVLSNPSLVCGNSHQWLSCSSSATGHIVSSDGGSYLCNQNSWVLCDRNTPTPQRGNFLCTQISNKWQWFSEFACSAIGKYKVRDQGTSAVSICDGQTWKSCSDASGPLFANDKTVEISCQADRMSVRELSCRDGIDNDNDGKLDCADEDCYSQIGSTNRYMTSLKRYNCVVNELITSTNRYLNMQLCDSGTDRLADRATICFGGSLRRVIQSVSSLRNTASSPAQEGGTTFLYFEPTTDFKEVHMVHTIDLSTQVAIVSIPLATFNKNLMSGQWLMLKLPDNQYYLLSHPTNETFFSLSKLQLKHIPLERSYPSSLYGGTNKYVFRVEGAKQIVVGIENDQVVLSTEEVGEAPAAFVTPQDLLRSYELVITKDTPTQITSPALGELTICRQDISTDLRQAIVCHNGNPIAALQKDNLTKINLQGVTKPYALLYNYSSGRKQVSFFDLKDLDQTGSGRIEALVYNDFIPALINDHRVAFEFSGNLYLLEHPKTPTFSLLSTKLTSITNGVRTEYLPTGSEDRIDFLFNSGRLSLQRRFAVPPLPFEVWAQTKRQVADTPISLDTDFSTSFSSDISVRVVDTPQPPYQLLSVSSQDLERDQGRVLINTEGTFSDGTRELTLRYKEPLVDGNTLFYYHTAQQQALTYRKVVAIYRLYDLLSATPQTKTFNNQFIEKITFGKEFALRFDETNYYLVGYQGDSGFFEMQNLRLRSLTGNGTFTPSVRENSARFTVPLGEVEINLNTLTNTLEFRKRSATDVSTTEFSDRYSYTLTSSRSVNVGGFTFSMCNVQTYRDVASANICAPTILDPLLNDIVIEPNQPQIKSLVGQQYLFEVNGQTGDRKEVTIRRVVSLANIGTFLTPLNWTKFVDGVLANDKPVFSINGTLYLPAATNSLLSSFALRRYGTNDLFPIQSVQTITPITFNGSIVLGDKVLFMTQTLTGPVQRRGIDMTMSLRNYYYLPSDNTPLKLTARQTMSIPFVTKVNGKEFTLTVRTPSATERLFRITLDPYLNRFFAQGNSRILPLESVPVEIRVDSHSRTVADQFIEANITIKRVVQS